jgi:hypothetical protein
VKYFFQSIDLADSEGKTGTLIFAEYSIYNDLPVIISIKLYTIDDGIISKQYMPHDPTILVEAAVTLLSAINMTLKEDKNKNNNKENDDNV